MTFEGRYFQLHEASLRTVVPPVPVWVASGGRQMFELTARYGSGWNMAGGGTHPGTVQEKYDGFAAACRAVGRDIRDFDVCKMSFVGVATDAAGARAMLDELATTRKTTPAALTERMIVATPDEIADRLRTFIDIGINHHIFSVSKSEQWPNYWDAVELVAREVIPRIRA